MCAGGRSLAEPALSPDGSRVACVVRDADGSRVVVVPTAGGGEQVVAADPEAAGRGGVVAWFPDGRRLAYVTKAGDVAVAPVGDDGPVWLLAEGVEGGAGGLAVAPDGSRVAFVAGTRAVTVVRVDGGPPVVVRSAADFAVDPSWSADADRVAWHEWDVPAMPWDASRIAVAPAGGGPGEVLAGGAGVSVQEPRFSPDGSWLAWVADTSGWATVWVAPAGGGAARPLVAGDEHEHAGPVWGPGGRSYAWSPDSTEIAFCRNEGGFGRLCVAKVDAGEVRELSRGVHTSLSWAGATIACLRSGARTPTSVVAIDAATGERRVLVTGPAPALVEVAEALPEPELVSWPADDGEQVHGRLWNPPGHHSTQPPPLLVWLHGGPTDQRRVTFDPRLAFFLSRGWAVLHPDVRGSTGWGRPWAQGLQGQWGALDVDDAAAGARAAVARGWGDSTRLVVMGASAGGMAALLLLARQPDVWIAGVALYPVVDLADLAASTHRYEAHYTVGLVGPLPEAAALYRSRSPLAAAAGIEAPVLLLHGDADEVVPVSQSQMLAAALRDRGVPVELHVYEGEGHGWGGPATTRDELERIEDFLARHGLPGDDRMGR